MSVRPSDDHGETRLRQALVLSALFLGVEVVGGLVANSLALLSDAGHMLIDVSALGLALLASVQGRRPRDAKRTYGYRRLEILAALGNGILLALIAGGVLREAWLRLDHPPEVRAGLMSVIALGGLAVNVVSLGLLRSCRHETMNLQAAFLHVVGDTLGSVGALAAGLIIRFTGWTRADPLASVLISVLILWGAVRLIRESLHYLLEGAPRDIRVHDVEQCFREFPGVIEIHDLHLWRISSGMDILTAHVVLQDLSAWRTTQRAIRSRLRERFGLAHSTLQIEVPEDLKDSGHSQGICDGY